MCDKAAYRKPEPPRQAEDIYAEYLKRIEDFKKRNHTDGDNNESTA